MKKTKIGLSLVLCVLMVVSMFGCTGGNGGNTEAPETTETPGTTAEVETTAEGKQATVYYDDYLTAIGEICPDDEFETADKLSLVTDTSVPEPITALKEKTKRFENLTNKDTIVNFVLNTLGI